MPDRLLFFVIIFLSFNLLSQKTAACGYSFIGECSTGIHLRINNTLDSFNVSECSFGKNFNGLNLGTISSLNLAKASAITWESCTNNVSSVGLYYRVYEQGMPSGNWTILSLPEDHNQLEGPYTARYRSQFSNANLVSGLTSGKNYVLEVYFLAQVDTIGDDFIPETTMIQNNGGQNYKLTFKYGGTTAPPFTVVTTHLTEANCFGDSTGIAGVTVYGNQSGLFYQWSNVNNNFHTLYELTAGTYTVTVSGSSGYTQSQTMVVAQPDPISISFTDVLGVACGSNPGSASAVVSGGTTPYSYLWETGEPDSIAAIPVPGNWALTVTDARACSAVSSVQVNGSTVLEQPLEKTICQGSSYTLGGQTFQSAGNYTVQVSGNGSCDTLFHLSLVVLNPADALASLPENAELTCASPTITLCATELPGHTFVWKKENVVLSTTACLTTNQSAPYEVFATLQQAALTCVASRIVEIDLHTDLPLIVVSGTASYTDCSSTLATVILTAQTEAVSPVFTWTVNGNTVSNSNTYTFTVNNPLDFTPPGLLVTDAFGCQGTSSGINLVINPAPGAPVVASTPTPASGTMTANGAIQLDISAGNPPYGVDWSNGSTGEDLSGLLPGEYCYTVSDAAGCATVGCVTVGVTNGTEVPESGSVHIFPNPVRSGASVQLMFSENRSGQVFSLELYNLQGQSISKKIQMADATGILLSIPEAIAPGTLFLQVRSGKTEQVFQLTVF